MAHMRFALAVVSTLVIVGTVAAAVPPRRDYCLVQSLEPAPGGFTVTWMRHNELVEPATHQLRMASFSFDGKLLSARKGETPKTSSAWPSTKRFLRGTLRPIEFIRAIPTSEGGWFGVQNLGEELFATLTSADGEALFDVLVLQHRAWVAPPEVALAQSGDNFVVAWVENSISVYAVVVNKDGGASRRDAPLFTGGGDIHSIAVATNGRNLLLAAAYASGPSLPAIDRVFAIRFDTALKKVDPVPLAIPGTRYGAGKVFAAANDDAFAIVWDDVSPRAVTLDRDGRFSRKIDLEPAVTKHSTGRSR